MPTETEHSYQPQLTEELETLFGRPFFTEGTFPDTLDDENLGFKQFIYRAGCRMLAEARAADRKAAAGKPQYEAKRWNDTWLTQRKLAEIAMGSSEQAAFLAGQIDLIDSAEDYLDEFWEPLTQRLYPDQQSYLLDIISAMQKQPRTVRYKDVDGFVANYDVAGVTAIAPTGFGKTRLIEASAKVVTAYGEEIPEGQRSRRVVLVVPSRLVLRHTHRHLTETMPERTVGVMDGDRQNPDADVVVCTIEMFNTHFRDNKLAGRPVEVVMVDEVHHLSEPQFCTTFLQQWHGMTLGFTATPAYDLDRDVRNIIPHVVEQTNIMTLIEKGRLNDGQIFTFLIDKIAYDMLLERYGATPSEEQMKYIVREVIDTLVIEFITPLIAEGRRGIIFCEAGREAYFARRLAERLQALTVNGAPVMAEAMYSAADNQFGIMEKFEAGQLQVITTVDTGREGLDAEFDFVIVNCNLISRLRGHQIVGRGTRPSQRFPSTVYAQFSNRVISSRSNREKLYSIEEAFGRRTINQGGNLRRGGSRSEGGEGRQVPGEVDISMFPDIVGVLLERIDRTAVGETFAGVNRGAWRVPEGYIPLRDIIEGYDTTELLARKQLRKAGYPWRGRYERIGTETRLAYYYPPDAQAYLRERLPKGRMYNADQAAEHFGVSVGIIRHIVNNPANGIQGRVVVRGRGLPPTCYDDDELAKIDAALKKMPGTQPGDGNVPALARELGVDEATARKLSGAPDDGRFLVNKAFPLTAAEMERARQEYHSIPAAEPGDKTIMQLAALAGIEWKVAERNLTPAEAALATPKRYKDTRGYERRGPVWPAADAQVIAKRLERFKARELPAHLVPSGMVKKFIRNYGVTPAETIAARLAEGGHKIEEMIIVGTNSMGKCLTWQAVAYLESVMGRNKGRGTPEINYNMLPTGPDDHDIDKILYAQSLQRQFVRGKLKSYAHMIEPEPEPEPAMPEPTRLTIEQLRGAIECSPEAFDYLLETSGIDEQTLLSGDQAAHEALDALRRNLPLRYGEWESLGVVAMACSRTSKEVVLAVIQDIAHERGRQAGPNEVAVMVGEKGADVYVSKEFKRIIRKRILYGEG